MTSESGAILTKACVDGGPGFNVDTTMLAVDVGERWRVRGCGPLELLYAGLGNARTCCKKLTSRKLACSSMTGGRSMGLC